VTFPSALDLFFIFFGIGSEVLAAATIHMGSGLGHYAVWCMVTNVLKKHSGFVFTGSRKMQAACPDQKLDTHESDYTVP
jgi:hypothetical protein